MIKTNDFKLMVFDAPEERNSNILKMQMWYIGTSLALFLLSYKEKEFKTIKNHEIIRQKHII